VIGFKAFKNTLKRDSGYAPVSGENGYSVIRCVFPADGDWDDISAVSAGFFVHPKDIAVVTATIRDEDEERFALFTIPGALLKQGERLHFGLFATVGGVTIATNTVVLDVARGIVSDDIDYDPTEAAGMFEQFSNALNTALLGKANKADAGSDGELAALDGNGSLKRSGVSVAESVGGGSYSKVPTTAAVKTALDGKADKLVDGDDVFTDRILIASNNGGLKNSHYTINNARLSGDVNLTVPSSNVVANALAGKADKVAAGTDGELAALDGNGSLKRSGLTVAESVGGGSNDMVPTTNAVRSYIFSELDNTLNGLNNGSPSLFVTQDAETGNFKLVYEDSDDNLHVLFDFGLLHIPDKENIVNKTTVLTANSTDAQYPSAKAAVKSLSEVSGVLDTGALTVLKGSSKKPLMTVDLKKDEQIFILFELAAPLNVDTYAYLTNANGVSILSGNSVVIGAGITSLLIPFRPTVDYNGAVVKYTVSSSASANAQLRSVKLLRPGMIPHQLFADGYHAVIAPSGVNSAAAFPHVYSADSMTVTTDGKSYCGARLLLFDFAVSSTLCVKAARDTGNQWALRIAFYDKDGQRVGTDVTGNNMIERTVSDGTAYIEIMFGACWGTALTAGTVVTFTGIEVYFSELVKLRQTVLGEGANTYNGARLDLSDPLAAVQRCDMSLWLDFRNVGDYRLDKNQSIAIYGDDLFLLQEGGGCVVVDRQTKTVFAMLDFAPTEYQHANSAQFTDIFYDSGDDYPLLMISRCGNVSVSPTTNLDECQFYRIHNGAMTLISRVYSDAGTYSASWGYDPSAKRIYMVGYTNGNYQVTTNNPLRFWVWKMPSASEICGGTDITLHTADCVGESQTEHLTLQGITVQDGIVYSGITRNGHHVYAFDVYGGSVISKIQLENNGFEVEGVAVADGRLYVSRKNGADTTGINPCKIYEIIFPAGGSARGLRGEKGDKGDPGDDYVLTAQDKADIANIVLQELPTTQEVLYGNASN